MSVAVNPDDATPRPVLEEEEVERHGEVFDPPLTAPPPEKPAKPVRKKRELTDKQRAALAKGRETSRLNRQKKAQVKKLKKEAESRADTEVLEVEYERKKAYKEQVRKEIEDERQAEMRKHLAAEKEVDDKKKAREEEKKKLREELKQEMELEKAIRLQDKIDPPPPKPREKKEEPPPPPLVYSTRRQKFQW
jgi:hypothetical protein